MIMNEQQIVDMKTACKILSDCYKMIETEVKVGVKLIDLDEKAETFIRSRGARPNFKNYMGFKNTMCTSLNSEVVHGKPDKRVLKDGDLLKCDAGCVYNGMHSDAARTYMIGNVSETARKLAEVTKQSFFEGIKNIKAGCTLNQIGYQIEKFVKKNGFSVVKDMVGHGIGTSLHMEPEVPNYETEHCKKIILSANMALAVEPMVNAGSDEVEYNSKTLLCTSSDGSLSSHYENTILITDKGVEILTL